MDPVPSTAGTMIIPKGVRHPYAALLLADFILSKEGAADPRQCRVFPRAPGRAAQGRAGLRHPRSAPACRSCSSVPDRLNKYTESSQKIFEELFR